MEQLTSLLRTSFDLPMTRIILSLFFLSGDGRSSAALAKSLVYTAALSVDRYLPQ